MSRLGYREGNRIPRDDRGEWDGCQRESRKYGVVVITSLGTASLLLSNAVICHARREARDGTKWI